MPKPLIFDSTPLIYLTRSSLTELLKEIHQPKFTVANVFEEIVREGKKKKAPEASLLEALFKKEVIKVHDVNNKDYLNYVKEIAAVHEIHPLHETEAEVLCLAKEVDGVAIADDKAARTVARMLGIELHGTGYVLGKVFATGKIDKEKLMEKVKEMRQSGWHVSATDYFKIINYLKNI